jgi:hypothetical protein
MNHQRIHSAKALGAYLESVLDGPLPGTKEDDIERAAGGPGQNQKNTTDEEMGMGEGDLDEPQDETDDNELKPKQESTMSGVRELTGMFESVMGEAGKKGYKQVEIADLKKLVPEAKLLKCKTSREAYEMLINAEKKLVDDWSKQYAEVGEADHTKMMDYVDNLFAKNNKDSGDKYWEGLRSGNLLRSFSMSDRVGVDMAIKKLRIFADDPVEAPEWKAFLKYAEEEGVSKQAISKLVAWEKS